MAAQAGNLNLIRPNLADPSPTYATSAATLAGICCWTAPRRSVTAWPPSCAVPKRWLCARAARAEQLADYRGEYLQRWNEQFGRGGFIEIVHCYQSFVQRLDEAVAQQHRQIEAHRAPAGAQLRQALVAAELRAASVIS